MPVYSTSPFSMQVYHSSLPPWKDNMDRSRKPTTCTFVQLLCMLVQVPDPTQEVSSEGFVQPETPPAQARGVLANVPALLVYRAGRSALAGRSLDFWADALRHGEGPCGWRESFPRTRTFLYILYCCPQARLPARPLHSPIGYGQ
jgi:hypothetical protein